MSGTHDPEKPATTAGPPTGPGSQWVTLDVDPHVHSEGSYDCDVPVEEVLAAAADAGLDALAITDHDTIERSLRAVELAPTYGLVAIPGIEVSTADGHLLALGVEEALEPGRPLRETAAEVRSRGGATVVPHPFQRTRHGASGRRGRGRDVQRTHGGRRP
jgi:predicted metal-dependent phosphoesterase TrpH